MILYKYYAPNANSLRLFTHKEIYFSKWSDFNDPFELMTKVVFDATIELKRDYFTKTTEHFKNELDDQERLNYIKSFEDMYGNGKSIVHVLKSGLSEIGIFSLSEKHNSMLMWSHYAKGHRGFCVEFDTDKDNNVFSDLNQVKYLKEYKVFNFYENTTRNEILVNKHSDWHYEYEWRAFKEKIGSVVINPECVNRIFLGASYYKNWDDNFNLDNDIIKLLKNPGFEHVQITYMEISSEKYELRDGSQ